VIKHILLIVILNALFFLKTLPYKYVSDDIPSSQRPKEKNKWKQWMFVLEGRARSKPILDHMITTLIHTLVCVFIYIGFGANTVSLMAALLFAFNPMNDQASVWISGRAYALSALGMTAAVAFPLLSPIFLLGASYYNSGFLAPICLIGSAHPLTFLFMPLIWLFHWKRFNKNVAEKIKMEMFTEDKTIKPEKIVLVLKTFGFYLLYSLMPFKTTFYHKFLQSAAGSMKDKAYTMKDKFFWIGLSGAVGIVYYWVTQPWSMVSFGLLWFCVCLAPFLNFIRIQQEIAQRYCYLPNVGLMFVLASILINYPSIFAAFLTMYAVKMWFWMEAYADDYYLVERSCMAEDKAWFVWHMRAVKRFDVQSFREAMILWTMAKMISPKEFKIMVNLATSLMLLNKKEEADKFMEEAMKNIPSGQEGQAKELMDNFKQGKLAVLV
jgi:hypothetical protein